VSKALARPVGKTVFTFAALTTRSAASIITALLGLTLGLTGNTEAAAAGFARGTLATSAAAAV